MDTADEISFHSLHFIYFSEMCALAADQFWNAWEEFLIAQT